MLPLLRFVFRFGAGHGMDVRPVSARTALQAVVVSRIEGQFSRPQVAWQASENGRVIDTGVYTHKLVASGALKKNQHQLMAYSNARANRAAGGVPV